MNEVIFILTALGILALFGLLPVLVKKMISLITSKEFNRSALSLTQSFQNQKDGDLMAGQNEVMKGKFW